MQKAVTVALTFAFSVFALLNCSKARMSPAEENVLKSLIEIQQNMNSHASHEKFVASLQDARSKISNLQQNSKINPCFMGAVEKCYASYEIAGKAWKKKMEAKDEKRKSDMDMTLSFSLSFAALNIEKAQKCYNK